MNSHTAFNFHMAAPLTQGVHPAPATSPSQSVPGRRTPLGAVGIGGYYAQGAHAATATHTHTDENRPGGSSERY